jgi:hypothetical protein
MTRSRSSRPAPAATVPTVPAPAATVTVETAPAVSVDVPTDDAIRSMTPAARQKVAMSLLLNGKSDEARHVLELPTGPTPAELLAAAIDTAALNLATLLAAAGQTVDATTPVAALAATVGRVTPESVTAAATAATTPAGKRERINRRRTADDVKAARGNWITPAGKTVTIKADAKRELGHAFVTPDGRTFDTPGPAVIHADGRPAGRAGAINGWHALKNASGVRLESVVPGTPIV